MATNAKKILIAMAIGGCIGMAKSIAELVIAKKQTKKAEDEMLEAMRKTDETIANILKAKEDKTKKRFDKIVEDYIKRSEEEVDQFKIECERLTRRAKELCEHEDESGE